MNKMLECIPSVQRIVDEGNYEPSRALEIQDSRANSTITDYEGKGWELESVSGSPEQGLVLVFKSVD